MKVFTKLLWWFATYLIDIVGFQGRFFKQFEGPRFALIAWWKVPTCIRWCIISPLFAACMPLYIICVMNHPTTAVSFCRISGISLHCICLLLHTTNFKKFMIFTIFLKSWVESVVHVVRSRLSIGYVIYHFHNQYMTILWQ